MSFSPFSILQFEKNMCRSLCVCLPHSLYHSILSYEQHQRRKWADDPRVRKALTSSRCLSICRTAAAKLVSHTGGIVHMHTLSHTHTHAHISVPWIDLIQPLNSESRDSRTGSVLEKTVVWNHYPRGGLRSELWLTPQQLQMHNETSEFAAWNLFELMLTTSLIRLKLGLKPWKEYLGLKYSSCNWVFFMLRLGKEEVLKLRSWERWWFTPIVVWASHIHLKNYISRCKC